MCIVCNGGNTTFLGKWLVLMGGVAEGYYYFPCFVFYVLG